MNKKVIAMVGKSKENYSACVIIGDGIAAAVGDTLTELKQQMKEAVEFHIECLREFNKLVPEPFDQNFELVFLFNNSMLKPAKRAKRLGLGKPVHEIIQQHEKKIMQPVRTAPQYFTTGKILQMHKEKLQMA
jgi:predicted RNase H-like HicB family nuclease